MPKLEIILMAIAKHSSIAILRIYTIATSLDSYQGSELEITYIIRDIVQTRGVNSMIPPSIMIAMEGRQWSTIDSQDAEDQIYQSALASQSVPSDNLWTLNS
ncbi:hypothetical protein CR513_20115, partial [Mucuna pruriens]